MATIDLARNVSESKGKGSARSKMLKAVMPKLSGTRAEKLGAAIDDGDGDAVLKIFIGIGKEMKTELDKKGKKSK